MLYTIKGALGFYREEQWQHIVKAAMKSEFGWQHSALEYFTLYNSLE
jgi:starch synthase